jgi:hypothetical protein
VCHFVLGGGGVNSPRKNPAYGPLSTHIPRSRTELETLSKVRAE